MKQRELIVIGGGAAGLFAGAIAAESGIGVTILEKNSRCGRKIGITGKGRCNLTNTKPWEEFARHIHPKNIFLKNAFYAMSNTKVMEFFERIGLPLVEERGNRVFPQSMRAQDVTDTLVKHITKLGGKIVTESPVEKINKSDDKELFEVHTSTGKIYTSEYLIIATGGMSYPTTGSTGDGYGFAKSMGHKITNCFPSLTAVTPTGYSTAFHNISLKNVELTLCVNGQEIQTEFGDLDFTNGGIEGPIGFKISRKAVYNLINGQKVAVKLDLKPAVSVEQLKKRIEREVAEMGANAQKRIDKEGTKAIASILLPKLMPKALIEPFTLANSGMTLQNLPHKLKEWQFQISSYVGYERSVVTAGGVTLSEVSQKSMESKLVDKLYFAGEVLDLDGDTGGYNLQIAFSTAALAAQSIAKKAI
ncbi:MAG: aminoacetone oxidase family FAD-binding enzyme [Bacteroidales bacterium]|nr:aminoacetone oxidase family FAD-binding enzyme [Bacteroidales bacterium]